MNETSGAAGKDIFLAQCSDVETPEVDFLPLSYDFFWAGDEGSSRILLASSISAEATFTLPGSAQRVIIRVKDTIGSYIEDEISVSIISSGGKRGILSYAYADQIFEDLLPEPVQNGDMDLIYQLLTELLFELNIPGEDIGSANSSALREEVAPIIQDKLILYPTDSNIEAKLYLLYLLVYVPQEINDTVATIVIEEMTNLLADSESKEVEWTDQSWQYAYDIIDLLFSASLSSDLYQDLAILLTDVSRYQSITLEPSTSYEYSDGNNYSLDVIQYSPSRLPASLSSDFGVQVDFSSDFKKMLGQSESSLGFVLIAYNNETVPFPGSGELKPTSYLAGFFIYHLSGSPLSQTPAPF
eukprot:TRINITY_DN927_c0_g1_i4.p1 TRINITY_DN927_c0_g1~~TRINITY_DN927_c0_g1_i4.p1  ORF type:complete len:356 (-),score=84.64 TRINITY_DN927_c0_g1_i4:1165-2232(-)